ncbi:hypothetical protein CJU94_10955 [Paraburkholderia aromaticivorans]|uniref:Uncharacterized protein n=1 Tax=Paraburkholderia aromaticivorans TaxID=2026199 RepID=A0A248VHY3_9BURK|nr:hypothetical protein CJU94_10955 [Paraburkholderia aromaticivorans]
MICPAHEIADRSMTPGEVQDLMLAFNKALIERAMGAEMKMPIDHLQIKERPTPKETPTQPRAPAPPRPLR